MNLGTAWSPDIEFISAVSQSSYPYFVTCAKGTEGALRKELVRLRIHAPKGAATE